jgi:hypothetical protein
MKSAFVKLWRAAFRSRPLVRTSWCWAFGRLARRPATGTSKRGASKASFAGAQLHGKTGRSKSGGICHGGKLFLEQRNLLVERAHAGQCAAGASAQDGAAARRNCRVRSARASLRRLSANSIQNAKTSASTMPFWSRGRRKANGGEYFLPARGFWLERSRLLDRAARASQREEQAARGKSGLQRRGYAGECGRQLHPCSRESLLRRWV